MKITLTAQQHHELAHRFMAATKSALGDREELGFLADHFDLVQSDADHDPKVVFDLVELVRAARAEGFNAGVKAAIEKLGEIQEQ